MLHQQKAYTVSALISPGALFLLNAFTSWHFHLYGLGYRRVGFDTKANAIFWTVLFGFWLSLTISIVIGLIIKDQRVYKYISSLYFKRWYVLSWCFLWLTLRAYASAFRPFYHLSSAALESNPFFLMILTMLGPLRFVYELLSLDLIQELFSISKSTLAYSMLMTFWIIPVSGLVIHHLFFGKYKFSFHVPVLTCFLTFCWTYSAFLMTAFD
ncbi:MAG: hypothetical protein AAGD96_02865 [Chloroflexota bacterium]